ncbi:unnamed protein product [Rotaria sp. Silwood1]|nr:unnamed protein product [Rotaria sp. Silwood1]
MDDALWTRFTRLDHLVIEENLNTVFEYIATRLDLSYITSFSYNRSDNETPSNDFLRILHNLPQLRSLSLTVSTLLFLFDRKWPKIVNLNIMSSYPFPSEPLISVQIDSFWRSFNRLETMSFCRESIQDVARLFDNRAMTLSTNALNQLYCTKDYQTIGKDLVIDIKNNKTKGKYIISYGPCSHSSVFNEVSAEKKSN